MTDTITVELPIRQDEHGYWRVDGWAFTEAQWRNFAARERVTDEVRIAAYVVAHIDAVKKREAEAWRDAKPGEGWILTVDGVEGRYIAKAASGPNDVLWFSGEVSLLDPFRFGAARITASRLAWPLDGE